MSVGRTMVIVQNKNCTDNTRRHHEHDAVEVRACVGDTMTKEKALDSLI